MIITKIKNPKKSASKFTRITKLIRYIRSPEKTQGKEKGIEKCVYAGARGFSFENEKAQEREMVALAQEAVRSKDPINHYVISWKEKEEPKREEVERSVDILLHELKMKEHQVVYGLHKDTENTHLHVVVNRVHPGTEKVIHPGRDIEAIHRACALIEKEQNWERERRGRYRVKENGEIVRIKEEEREKEFTKKKGRERKKEALLWKQYQRSKRRYEEKSRERRKELREKHKQEKKKQKEEQRERREKVFRGSFKGKGQLLNALRKEIAREQKEERKKLQEKQKKEREFLKERTRSYPRFLEWQKERKKEKEKSKEDRSRTR